MNKPLSFLGSAHSQRLCVDKKCFSIDLCVFRPTRAGCTLNNSKAGRAATLLPRGQSEPTMASDLDINNDHNKSDNDNENDTVDDKSDKNDDNDNDNEIVENCKIKMKKKKKFSFHSGRGRP